MNNELYNFAGLNTNELNLSDFTAHMTTLQLVMVADSFENAAIRMRKLAYDRDLAQAESARFDKELDFFQNDMPLVVAKFLKRGMAHEAAIDATANVLKVYRKCVEIHYKNWRKGTSDAHRRQRDDLIYQLAGKGLTNEQIAERVGMHPNSIPRILKQFFKTKRPVGLLTLSAAALAQEDSQGTSNNGTNSSPRAASSHVGGPRPLYGISRRRQFRAASQLAKAYKQSGQASVA